MSKKQMPILCFTLLLYLVLVYLPMSSIIPITHLFFLIPSSKHLNSQGPIHECLEKNLYYTDISQTFRRLLLISAPAIFFTWLSVNKPL